MYIFSPPPHPSTPPSIYRGNPRGGGEEREGRGEGGPPLSAFPQTLFGGIGGGDRVGGIQLIPPHPSDAPRPSLPNLP